MTSLKELQQIVKAVKFKNNILVVWDVLTTSQGRLVDVDIVVRFDLSESFVKIGSYRSGKAIKLWASKGFIDKKAIAPSIWIGGGAALVPLSVRVGANSYSFFHCLDATASRVALEHAMKTKDLIALWYAYTHYLYQDHWAPSANNFLVSVPGDAETVYNEW